MIVFRKQWFERHQKALLWFVNTRIGKRFFRISGDVPKGKRIVRILPNCFTWEEGKNEAGRTIYSTDFRTHPKFAKRLYYGLKPVWYLLHFIDWLLNQTRVPALQNAFGFDTLTAYPDPGSGSTTCDGSLQALGPYSSWSAIHNETTAYNTNLAAIWFWASIYTDTTTDWWKDLRRSVANFDTSSMPTQSFITDASVSLAGSAKANTLGGTAAQQALSIVGVTPASDNTLVVGDYSQFSATRYASDIAYADFLTGGSYNVFSLNAQGVAAIDVDGVTNIGVRFAADVDDSPPAWVSDKYLMYTIYAADQTGTTQDPKLVVSYYEVSYSAFKNRKTGITPVWILKCAFATGTVYLSDRALTVANWTAEGGSKTTKRWVDQWGAIDPDIGAGLEDARVSDMTIGFVIDDASPNIEDLVWNPANLLEATTCTLFLWFEGLDASIDPPQAKWTGNIKDPHQLDEQHCQITFVDESLRLKSPVGTLLDPVDYPGADPDDIGKMIPIVYGSVKNVPALAIDAGVTTTLATTTTAAATSLSLTSTTGLAASSVVQIENEQILVGGISGNLITGCTRGYNGTTATTHDKGMQVWEIQSEYWYILADHPVKAITTVYVDGVRQAGSDFTVYTNSGGKAKIKFTARPVLEKSIDIEVDDNAKVTDYTVSHSDGISHNASATKNQTAATLYDFGSPQNWAEGTGNYKTVAMFNHPGFTYGEVLVNINAALAIELGTSDKTFYCRLRQGGTTSAWQVLGYRPGGSSSVWTWYNPVLLTFSAISSGDVYIDVYHTGVNEVDNWDTLSCTMTARGDATVSGTGASSKTAAIKDKIDGGKGYYIGLTGNSSAEVVVGKLITADMEGYQDDGSGTWTGTPNALIERPDHVIKHFLATYCNYTSFYTDAGANFAANAYAFAGVMNSYKDARWWLNRLAWQCRCWFRLHAGQARLTWRADTITSVKTIGSDTIRMRDRGLSSLQGPWLSPLSEVINKIHVKFDRNWTQTGADAYEGIKKLSDATSITRYGTKERPELFLFDFVADATMANHVGSFYLLKLKNRKKCFKWETVLMHEDLGFGSGITLTPKGSILCELRKPALYPGSGRAGRIDGITIEARED